MPLVQDAEHAVLLSGTPMISRPKEMLTQLTALVPKARLKMKDFGERYCMSVNQRFGKYDGELPRPCIWDALDRMADSLRMNTSSSAGEARLGAGCINHEELNRLLISTVMVRRLKKDVLDQLPPKRRQQVSDTLQKSPTQAVPPFSAGKLGHKACDACMRQAATPLIGWKTVLQLRVRSSGAKNSRQWLRPAALACRCS